MKRIVICATAIGLLASAPLYAQNNDHRDDRQNTAAPEHEKGERPASQQKERQRPATNPAPMGRAEHMGPAAHANSEPTSKNMATPGNAMQIRPPVDNRMGHANQPAVAPNNRPDLNAFRRNMQAPKQFRGGNYRAPQGYHNRHWSYGERLPRGYFLRNYWISNFMLYGLFAPPADLIWVRVGNDALLIDRDSGDIVQVRYGLFY